MCSDESHRKALKHQVKIRAADTLDDIDRVVECHIQALATDVAPAFGKPFLKRYYQSNNEAASATLLVAENDQAFCGFVLVSTEKKSMTSSLNFRALVTFLRSTFQDKSLLWLLFRQFFQPQPFPDENTAEISFIATADQWRGQGIGTAMVAHAGEFARISGKDFLATKTANIALAKYYQREFSAETVSVFKVGGREYSVLRWSV